MSRAVVALLGVAAVCVPLALGAQGSLRGVVRDSTSQLPLAGAVVTAYDSAGRASRRTLSDERGTYAVAVGAGSWRLRIVRLGFRPTEVIVSAGRDSVAHADVVMSRIPYSLQPVRVTSAATCPRRSDRVAALALLEDARSGLLATVVARSDRPARMKRLMIDRRIDARTNAVLRHAVNVQTVPSTVAAFGGALSAEAFVSDGFAVDGAAGATFHAPDAEVLLDDGFAAAYCFHVVDRDSARPNQVGLGFRAANRGAGRIDVDGALWVDTVARTLVEIEYRYVGLHPTAMFLRPGGRVAFRELPNGVVLIDQWMVRLVGLERDTVRRSVDPSARTRGLGQTVGERYVVGEVGGELARVAFDNGFTWAASLGTLSLTVTSDRGTPKPGVVVSLDDTNYEGMTDSAGRLVIADLAPGPYAALIGDTRLDAIDISLATPLSFPAERGRTASLVVHAMSAEDFIADRCLADRQPEFDGKRPPGRDSGFVIGRVFSPAREVVEGVSWTMSIRVGDGPDERRDGLATRSDGVFVRCGVPFGADIVFSFRKAGMASGSVGRVIKGPLTVLAVQMDPDTRKRN